MQNSQRKSNLRNNQARKQIVKKVSQEIWESHIWMNLTDTMLSSLICPSYKHKIIIAIPWTKPWPN